MAVAIFNKYFLIKNIDLVDDINNIILNLPWCDQLLCLEYLKTVFLDRSLLHYMMKYFSSILTDRKDNIMLVFYGKGNNSRSTLGKLILTTFHNEVTHVTSDGELRPIKKLCIVHHYTEALIKRLISSDHLYVRPLYQNEQMIKSTFKVIGTIDDPRIFNNFRISTLNRIKIIPFVNRFNYQENHYTNNIGQLSEAFRYLLNLYLPIYIQEGLKEPDIIKAYHQLIFS